MEVQPPSVVAVLAPLEVMRPVALLLRTQEEELVHGLARGNIPV